MVSLKKVGAIAAGALFVGATVGVAATAAVSVPSDMSADMLAKNGEPMAQLVVGKNAPGKDADTASAEVIKEAVASKLKVSGAGGDIVIEYSRQDLDDDGTPDNEFGNTYNKTGLKAARAATTDIQLTSTNVGDGVYISLTKNLKYDANGDGDLKDDDDYELYNGVYVLDASGGEIQMAYTPVGDSTYYIAPMGVGDVVKLRGSKYVITDADLSDQAAKLAPAITKSLIPASDVDPNKAVVISGTKKMLLYNGSLYLYDGNSLLETVTLYNSADYLDYSKNLTSDEFKVYKLYVQYNATTKKALVTMAEKSQEVEVSNDQEGVMGYYKIKVNDTDFPNPGSAIILLSEPISLVKDDTVEIPDTYYVAKFTLDKYLDIKRKKTATVSSGTQLKSTIDPGKDFLKSGEKITLSISGGTEKTPELEIVDEDTADQNMNLVLIGGPVANKMTADLVNAGKSKVDWYKSEGDIEVIKDAFKTGKYAIIVAGKDRDATKAAAEALAAWL